MTADYIPVKSNQMDSTNDLLFPLPILNSHQYSSIGLTGLTKPSTYSESNSSASSSRESLLEENDEDLEKHGLIESTRTHARTTTGVKLRRRHLILALPILILILIIFPIYYIFNSSTKHTYHGQGLNKITMEHLANGTFEVKRQSFDWLAQAGDSVYSYRLPDGSIELMDVNTNTSRILVKGTDVKDMNGNQLQWDTFKVSADLQYILFGVDELGQWRHSSHSNFYTHSISTFETYPLLTPSNPPQTSIASFSPINHHLVWVYKNDLYVREKPRTSFPSASSSKQDGQEEEGIIRITKDGSKTTFNGVPDWVYEEEVFATDTTTFWSPDGNKLAFISFDEELVNEYEFPIYNKDENQPGGDPYPGKVVMKYPKPGYPNPKVKVSVFDLSSYLLAQSTTATTKGSTTPSVSSHLYSLLFSNPFDSNDLIITEISWVGTIDLMIKFTNRIATIERVAHFKLDSNNLVQIFQDENRMKMVKEIIGKVVREKNYLELDGGWVEPGHNIIGIDSTLLLHSLQLTTSSSSSSNVKLVKKALQENLYASGYLDLIPNAQGFNHIAYFSPPDSDEPLFLTDGEWEVDGGIKGIDVARGLVYFISANPSIDRHLQSVSLPTSSQLSQLKLEKIPSITTLVELTNMKESGYYKADFSPFMGFYVLSYEGPKIPYQKLIKVGDEDFVDILNDNAELEQIDATFAKSEFIYSTVQSEGIELNCAELRPPFMDLSGRTKYPVLFQVYGGPASQMVSTRFIRDWKHYLTSSLGYIIIIVDPRGTGFKGRNFRMGVRDHLGQLEALDVVNVGKHFASLPYVDEKRLAIWGWSYGGYLTAKVIETDSRVFGLGMSVAPVTDWRYYDTIYTERYMSTPELNPGGYQNSSVTKMEGFKHASFALAAGTGDDNVHFLNSAALMDRLTFAQVRGVRFRMFTDSDHSIRMRGAYWELMEWLTEFLVEKFGEGGRTKFHWKMMHVLGDRDRGE